MQGGGGISKKSTSNQSYQGIKEVDSKLETTQEQTKAPIFNLNLPNPASPFILHHEISSANERFSHKKHFDDLSPDFNDRAIPRTSPRIRPEEHPMFEEPSASRVPSKIMTPNNVSSFIELLNYNSETDNDPNEAAKSRMDNSRLQNHNTDTTQEFIKEALADIRASNAKSKVPVPKIAAQTNQPSPEKAAPFRRATRLFPNIDEEMKKHTLCGFPGLEFIRPIKHSTRAVLPEKSPSIVFEGLVPLVDLSKVATCHSENRSAL
jgi:hypothetical protein